MQLKRTSIVFYPSVELLYAALNPLLVSKKHLWDNKKDWRKVLWSDEEKINLFGSDGGIYVRRKNGSRFNSSNLKFTVKGVGGLVMVWACMSSNGVGRIKIIDGKMKALDYSKVLN